MTEAFERVLETTRKNWESTVESLTLTKEEL